MRPEKKQFALTDEAKGVLALLKAASTFPLTDLKTQTGLSNKKWDKAIKELTKNNLAKVEKTEDALLVSFTG